MTDDTEDMPMQDWLSEAVRRLEEETICLHGHWGAIMEEWETDRAAKDSSVGAHLYKCVKHLESLAIGVATTMAAVMAYVPADMLAEIVREKMEIDGGRPVKMERIALPGGLEGYAYSHEEIVVPDTIEELEGEA